MRGSIVSLVAIVAVSCPQMQACPSPAGGACDPREANCPKNYYCAVAEVCTRSCAEDHDCWIRVDDGCRPSTFPGMSLADGGIANESSDDGYCAETKALSCFEGYCQYVACADGGCDYDVYGPSPFKGNRTQGPEQ